MFGEKINNKKSHFGVIMLFAGLVLIGGCLSPNEAVTNDDASSEKVVVHEVKPEEGVKVIDLAMEVRYYSINHPCLERMGLQKSFDEVKTSEVVAKETLDERAWKELLAGFDVLWPEGSSLVYLRDNGMLRVRNTAENHEHITEAISRLSQVRKQIEVSVEVLSVEQKTLDAIGQELVKGKADGARYVLSDFENIPVSQFRARLVGDRDVKIVSSAKTVADDQECACIKDVVECIYPQDYDVSLGEMAYVSSNATRQVRQAGIAAVEPQNLTKRDVGTILEVTPVLVGGDSANNVSLFLKQEYVGEPSWEDFGMRLPAPDGGTYAMPMNQPFFPCRAVDTRIHLRLGDYALVGAARVAPKSGNEDSISLVFVRARLID